MQIAARLCSAFVPARAGADVPSFRCLARGTKERAGCRAISPEPLRCNRPGAPFHRFTPKAVKR